MSQDTPPAARRGAIQRRFVFLALLALLPLAILLGVLGWREYQLQRATVLNTREATMKARQLEMERLAAVTRSEVSMLANTLSADLEINWAEPPQLDGIDLGTGANGIVLNRRPDPGRGERHGAVFGVPDTLRARASSRTELAAVERLFPIQAATHAANAKLRWTYFLSASRDLAAVYPWASARMLLGSPSDEGAAFRRLFEGDLFQMFTSEAGKTQGAFWTPVQLDFTRDLSVVTFAVPVVAHGLRRGLVAGDVYATEFARILASVDVPGTAISVVDPRGDILVTSSLGVSVEGLGFLSRDLATHLTPGFRGILEGQNIVVAAIDGTPWRMVAMTPDSYVQRRALHAIIPYALSLAGVIATLGIVFILLQYQLVRPAARLARYIAAEADGEVMAPPDVPPAWRSLSEKVSAAAREREAHLHQLRAMIDGIPLRAVYVDHAYVYRDANKEFLDFVGITIDELTGKTISEVLGMNVQQEYVRMAPRIHAGEVARFEGWIAYEGRGPRFLQVSILPFKALDEDQPGFLTFTRDLTDLKQAELDSVKSTEALAASEALHRAVVISSLDAIVVVDDKGVTLEFNPTAEAIFGYAASEVIGKPIGDLIVPHAVRTAHEDGMQRYLSTGVPHVIGRRVEVEGLRRDGSLVPVELSVTEVLAGGRRIFTSHLRDLTESRTKARELEEQREKLHQAEKMTAMGSLLAGVAHELNNPLAVVVAQSTLLEETAETPAMRKRAERIHAAADRCGRIVKTFLAMARQQAPSWTLVSLPSVIDSALAVTLYGLRTSGIQVETEFGARTPLVDADADQLAQVISNLLINAQQAFAAKDPPRLLRIETGRAPSGRAFVRIADNGPGVPIALRERIFDAYFTTKAAGVGTGIGLSVCKNIVQAHGGTLVLEANEDDGASFLIELPESAASATVAVPVHPQAALAGRTILVVDDEPDVGATLAEILERMGAVVALTASRAEALARIGQQDFDLVMSDLRMPDGGGIELQADLDARQNPLAGRLVFVTGDTVAGPALISKSAKGEPPLVLEKPFSPADVARVVAAALARRTETAGA
jgi:PAS domain S-box-containing protein